MSVCHSRVTACLQSIEEPPEQGTWPPSTSVLPTRRQSPLHSLYTPQRTSKAIPDLRPEGRRHPMGQAARNRRPDRTLPAEPGSVETDPGRPDRPLHRACPPDLPASARDYARHLRWWKDQLGSYYLSDISPRLIDDCKHKLLREPGPKGKRSNATVNRYLTTLSAVYTYGMSPAVSWVTTTQNRSTGSTLRRRRTAPVSRARRGGPQGSRLPSGHGVPPFLFSTTRGKHVSMALCTNPRPTKSPLSDHGCS